MPEYNFSTLNGTDLEELACDLLNAALPQGSKINYKTFKEGKDKGIDFLYSTESNDYEHIGQVKHYLNSGYKSLISTLKNTELSKIKALNPNKYIVVTSVDLSVQNTLDIKDYLKPFVKAIGDIYGKKDLNRLIGTYPNVLNNHFKLWFSDTTVLKKIVHSNLEFRSVDFSKNEIVKRIKIYVETPAFKKANNSLKKNKFVLITGEPGVGKTTLAEMLAYEYIKDDYELIYVYDSIRDVDAVLATDDSKQIIYFDDFLGSNEVEINKSRGSDTILNKIIRRVKNGTNKFLIFTTRKHILNRAIQESEKLKRLKLFRGENILHLHEYSPDIKKQLLTNHIDASELPKAYKALLYSKKLFKFVLKHRHFTPRSIEFITSKETVGDTLLQNFESFVKDSFNNPTEIWKYAYTYQLKEDDRLLLSTLLSFGNEVSKHKLQLAFDARVDFEVENNNKTRVMHAFNLAFQRLLGGFIYATHDNKVRFINPSIIDFLVKYIKTDYAEVSKIISSIINVNQLTKRLFALTITHKQPSMPLYLQKKLLSSYDSFLTGDDNDTELIVMALAIYKYVDSKQKEDVVSEILEKIEDWDALYENYELSVSFRDFMSAVKGSPKISLVIEERILEIINEIVLSDSDIDGAHDMLSGLVTKYNINLALFDTTRLNNHFSQILDDHMLNEIDVLKEYTTNENDSLDLEQQIKYKIESLVKLGLKIDLDLREITSINWWEVATGNEFDRQMSKDD